MATTRERGNLGEDFACAQMERDGYEILERNWHNGRAEVDIIARRAEVIAFVEVKTRTQSALTVPMGAVSRAQRRRIALAAVAYLQARGIYNTGTVQPRFDIFELVTERAGSPVVMRYFHMKSAYDVGDLNVFI